MTTARQPRNKAPLRLAENGIICVGVVQRRPADPGDRAGPAVDPAEVGDPDGRDGPDGPADLDGRADPEGSGDLPDLVCPGALDARCDPVDRAERDGLDGQDDPGGLNDPRHLDGPGVSDVRCHPGDPDESGGPDGLG